MAAMRTMSFDGMLQLYGANKVPGAGVGERADGSRAEAEPQPHSPAPRPVLVFSKLFVQRGDGLLQHRAVRGGAGTLEVSGRARPGKLETLASCQPGLFVGRQLRDRRLLARGLLLLELDHLGLEASPHTPPIIK